MSARKKLPNRRPCCIETLEVAGQPFTACIGFDPETGQPKELFLNGGKEGSQFDGMLSDAATTISVALQYGIPAKALAKSIGRLPGNGVAGLSNVTSTSLLPASPIGAAIDLLCSFENGATEE